MGRWKKHTAAPMLIALVYQQLRKKIAECGSARQIALYTPQMAAGDGPSDIGERRQGLVRRQNDELIRAFDAANQPLPPFSNIAWNQSPRHLRGVELRFAGRSTSAIFFRSC